MNERAAAAAGVNVYAAKMYSFMLASALAAVAGTLMAFRNTNVLAGQFSVFPSINIVGMTVVGGVGSVGGAIFGSTLLQGGVGSELLRSFHNIERYLPLAGGIMLLFILRTDQNGLYAMNAHMAHQIKHGVSRLFRRHAEEKPAKRDALAGYDVESAADRVPPRVLEVKGLTVQFGGVVAVNNLTIDLQPGEIQGLIGPNGAGKTTVIDAITGFVRPRSGAITLAGATVTDGARGVAPGPGSRGRSSHSSCSTI